MSQRIGRREEEHIWIIRWKSGEMACKRGTYEEAKAVAERLAEEKGKEYVIVAYEEI